jgi:hypothetical protein
VLATHAYPSYGSPLWLSTRLWRLCDFLCKQFCFSCNTNTVPAILVVPGSTVAESVAVNIVAVVGPRLTAMYCPGCKFMRQKRDWKPSQWCKGRAKTNFFSNCKICSGENRDYGLGWRLGGELPRHSSTTGSENKPRDNGDAVGFVAADSGKDTPDPSSCTVGRGVSPSFLVIIRRLNRKKLGFKVAVDGNILLIHAIEEKSPVSEWNKKCRTCGVPDLMKQQLLESDQLVNINGEIEPLGIMQQLLNLNIESFYMRIRRLPS